MDFYFVNNLIRIDFEGILMEWINEKREWKVLGIGYPYLTFKFINMSFSFEVYDKNDDNKLFEADLNRYVLELKKNKLSLIFFDKENNIYRGFSFAIKTSFLIFISHLNKYEIIEEKYIKSFLGCSENIISKIDYFKQFLNNFEIKEKHNYGAFLPFIYIMLKENLMFIHVFESFFSKYYMRYRVYNDVLALQNTKKIINITAHLFLAIDMNILKKILLSGFFQIIKELIKAKRKIEGNKFEIYEDFLAKRTQFLKKFQLTSFSKTDLELFNRLQFVMKNLLSNQIDEKYLQVYTNIISKKNIELWEDIFNEEKNIEYIAFETKKRKVCFIFYFLELVMNMKKKKILLNQIFKMFKKCDLMNKMIQCVLKMTFKRINKKIILINNGKNLLKKDNLLKFLDLFSLVINNNNHCFFKIFFNPNEIKTQYKKLRYIFNFHFQSNFENLQFISLGLITCVFNNLKILNNKKERYFKIINKIIWYNLDFYEEFNNKNCLLFLNLVFKRKEPLIIKKFFNNKFFVEKLINNFQIKNKLVWCYTLNILDTLLYEIKDLDLLEKIFSFFFSYFIKIRRINLIGSKIIVLVKKGYEKKIDYYQLFFSILNKIVTKNFCKNHKKTLIFNFQALN